MSNIFDFTNITHAYADTYAREQLQEVGTQVLAYMEKRLKEVIGKPEHLALEKLHKQMSKHISEKRRELPGAGIWARLTNRGLPVIVVSGNYGDSRYAVGKRGTNRAGG